MNEYGDDGAVTGTFDGWYVPGIRISGNWTNQKTNDVMPFELKILNGISDNAVWSGEWKRVNGGLFNSADLVIFSESSESFDFQINAFNGGHSGFIGGTADIEGETGIIWTRKPARSCPLYWKTQSSNWRRTMPPMRRQAPASYLEEHIQQMNEAMTLHC